MPTMSMVMPNEIHLDDFDMEKPKKVTREDMLHLSNVALRLQSVQLQEELLKRDLAKANSDKQALQSEMQQASNALHQKYGLDPSRHRVTADGTIVPIEAGDNGNARRA